MNKRELTVALAGNPNVGKSTVFNALTGLKQHTGNWTGKTVDLAQGTLERQDIIYKFVDVPGTYSLKPRSKEEVVAGDFINFGNVDVVAVVCDATNLERNLYLTLQILETGIKTVVCLNLLDEAKKKGITINTALLEKELGVPVVGMTARSGVGIEELLKELSRNADNKAIKIKYTDDVEKAIEYILPVLKKHHITKLNHRWLALRLLEEDSSVKKYIEKNSELNEKQKDEVIKSAILAREFLKTKIESEKLSEIIASALYKASSRISNSVNLHSNKDYKLTGSEKIFTKTFSAYFVMFVMLSLILYITISGANYPSQWLSSFFLLVRAEADVLC